MSSEEFKTTLSTREKPDKCDRCDGGGKLSPYRGSSDEVFWYCKLCANFLGIS